MHKLSSLHHFYVNSMPPFYIFLYALIRCLYLKSQFSRREGSMILCYTVGNCRVYRYCRNWMKRKRTDF